MALARVNSKMTELRVSDEQSLASDLNRASGSSPWTISRNGRIVLAADAWHASSCATSASTDGGMRSAIGVAVADMVEWQRVGQPVRTAELKHLQRRHLAPSFKPHNCRQAQVSLLLGQLLSPIAFSLFVIRSSAMLGCVESILQFSSSAW